MTEDIKTKQLLEDNLVLFVDEKSGARRIGNLKESLKGIRDEIEELKRCFNNSPDLMPP